ncbi:MAG: efflux family protein [Clostridia bacterium]|nr:efflux family protein [Clostridia bacterium]
MKFFTKDKILYKSFFTLTLMIALQNIITYSVNLADNVMIGAYSENALSGVAIVNQIQFLLQLIITGAGEGIVVIASRYWGKKEPDPIRRITGIGMQIALTITLLVWAVVFFFPHQSLALFTDDTAVIEEGAKYLIIVSFTYLLFAITSIFISALRSVETVKIGFVVSLSALVVNICLNYVLIYGKFGFPEMGIEGAAIATLISRIAEFIIIIIFIIFFDKKIKLSIIDFFKIDFNLLKNYIKVSLPIILSGASWGIAMSIQTAILGRLESALPASSIANTVFQILTVITYGSASASSVVIGKTIGEGKIGKLKEYVRTLQIIYIFIGLLTGLGIFFSKDLILSFYTISEQTKIIAEQFMMVLSVTVVGTSYQVACLTGIVRGGGDTKFVLFNDLIFMWCLVLPISSIAAFLFGLPPVIVFICLKSDQILKCFVAIFKVNRFKWVKNI